MGRLRAAGATAAADQPRKPFNTNDNPPRLSLLGLPPELKNRIYREVLVEDEYDRISFHSYRAGPCEYDKFEPDKAEEPGLLCACSLIRKEARLIFLQENYFVHHLQNGKLEPQLRHWFWSGVRASEREFELSGVVQFANVVPRLKAVWAERLSARLVRDVFDAETYGYAEVKVVKHALTIVESLKSMRWETVKQVLDEFEAAFKAAGQTDWM